jgi:O-antigen ligase
MTVSMGLSYLVWFNLIQIKHATPANPTPFISHIVYGPFLAFATYIALHEILFTNIGLTKKAALAILACLMIGNLTLTLGRTGHVVFFALIILLTFQHFRKQYFRAFLVSFLLAVSLFSGGYYLSPAFQQRINLTVDNLTDFKATKKQSSVGERLTFLINSLELTRKNLLIGVGTGDYVQEYKKLNAQNSPAYRATDNPHNQYLRVSSQLGLLGLIVFLSIFYYLIQNSLTTNYRFSNLHIAFPIFYLIIFLGDSYLQTNTTTLLFASFGGFLSKTPPSGTAAKRKPGSAAQQILHVKNDFDATPEDFKEYQ